MGGDDQMSDRVVSASAVSAPTPRRFPHRRGERPDGGSWRKTTALATVPEVKVDARTELVIAVEIAKRLGISPQRVYVLAARSGFPKPIGMLGRSAVWRWSTVERWARDSGRLPADDAAA
jgi:predicted DNA-binding transcriptional regulator AlpA